MLTFSESPEALVVPSAGVERLSQRAYQAIRVALKSGELRPGQRLILRPLASKLGLSATPVREALLRLVSEQALGLDERNSVLVPSVGIDELDELQELRIDLEGRAAQVSATRANPDDIAALVDIQQKLRDAVAAGLVSFAGELNEAFHDRVLTISGRPTLLRMVDALRLRLGPLVSLQNAFGSELPVDHHHDRLIEALRARDPDAARIAITRDIESNFAHMRAVITMRRNDQRGLG